MSQKKLVNNDSYESKLDMPMAFAYDPAKNMFGNPMRDVSVLRIQKKWADKKINCCLEGILKECGGCCHGKPGWLALNVYPMSAYETQNGFGWCGHFKENEGCEWDETERNTLCLLYPFYIKNGELLLWWRALGGSCRKAYKTQDTPIFEFYKTTWTVLFGAEQYERVYKDLFIDNKEESYFKASKRFMLIHDKEMELCNKNIPPVSRSEVWKTYFDSMYTEDGELRFEFKK